MALHGFNQFVLSAPHRVSMPIAVYPGRAITGARVAEIVADPGAQFDAQVALHERFSTRLVLSAMDLSAEAEAFGCTLYTAPDEIPSVTGRLVTDLSQARRLAIPTPGDKRTAVFLETVRRLRQLPDRPLVLGGCIGPFSLAARLVGVSEAMEMTVTEPDLMHVLLEKSAEFLAAYLRAFREAGADGVIMAEPAAGLLSPRSMATLSSSYIRQIGEAVEDEQFALILHNCAAKLLHLPAILETGLASFHFGAPMDMVAALGQVPSDIVLCGNLDPTAVFAQLMPDEIAGRTTALLDRTSAQRNFVVSSGCDLPPTVPIPNLEAFFAATAASAPAAPS